MFTSNNTKLFVFAFAVVFYSTSCRYLQTSVDKNDSVESTGISKQASPFQTKNPEKFQAEIKVTIFANNGGEKAERRYFVAKDKLDSYTVFDFGGENETALIETSAGKRYVLDMKKQTYQETAINNSQSGKNELQNYLTTKWLNEKRDAKFEMIGVENEQQKFRVIIDESKNSEAIIFIDQKLGIPIRQEFYSRSNGKKNLSYMVEMTNVKTTVLQSYFSVPDLFTKATN